MPSNIVAKNVPPSHEKIPRHAGRLSETCMVYTTDSFEFKWQMQVMAANGSMIQQKLPANFSKSIEHADMQMGFLTNVEWKVNRGHVIDTAI
jgi:hypothetical protein